MRRWKNRNYISKNGLDPDTNRFIGSLTYFIFHSIIFLVSYKIWGIDMFEEVFFYLMHLATFFLVGFTLRKLKIWVY
ncbi:MAG: hypothetical protein A2431_00380 [Candidatus Zambryskibacteria bacterium RIFOXYC1_FULL_39_10]|uniref:Uncharacterized protein n=1 Tax=Candidatus Zambryskibacteria bacterium RIFOXYC1_FULL_39_10 TaxID=1802779 RepID=A0A1G2UZG7_9BACT|nr:MAG: hypothetical protein A2431_00380 [Candidatus Zambryskibacteria bacterium RIFOXYC1_FULL_39_10]